MSNRRKFDAGQGFGAKVAPLKQIRLFETLFETLTGRRNHLPGLGVFYGPAGFGKSTAAAYAVANHNAASVTMYSFVSKSGVLELILAALGIQPGRNMAQNIGLIVDELHTTRRVLVVDEMDHLVEKRAVEVIRDIYEMAAVPIIMIGEESFPRKLARWERMHSRVLSFQQAAAVDRDDFASLAKFYAPDITIDAALRDQILHLARGSVRRVAVNLDRVREYALMEGASTITLKDWGDRELYTGEAPARRFS